MDECQPEDSKWEDVQSEGSKLVCEITDHLGVGHGTRWDEFTYSMVCRCHLVVNSMPGFCGI